MFYCANEKNVFSVPVGVSFSLHGSEPHQRSPHHHRVPPQPSASGYQAADRLLAFLSCGEAETMEESSSKAEDSSTQDNVPPLGETLGLQPSGLFVYRDWFKCKRGVYVREILSCCGTGQLLGFDQP